MKTLNERLNLNINSKITTRSNWEFGIEGSEVNEDIDVIAINMQGNKKKTYGYFCFNEDSNQLYLMNFDSIKDLQKAYSIDMGWEELENIDPKEYYYDKTDGSHYFRVW